MSSTSARPCSPPGEVLFRAEELQERAAELGAQIASDYRGKSLHLIGSLIGGATFACDLMRHISLPVTLDFISVLSYGPQSRGSARITKDLDHNIHDADVLVVEGIVDTGFTLAYVLRNLQTRGPASLAVCTMLDKPARRIIDIPIKYRGFEIPDVFVVGYGLDWGQQWRNLPDVVRLDMARLNDQAGDAFPP